MQQLRLLLVAARERDAESLVANLGPAAFDAALTRVDDAEALGAALGSSAWDIIICDFDVPARDAPDVIALIRRVDPDVPIVVVSGTAGEESAVAVMRAGAQDCVARERIVRLAAVVRRELSLDAARREKIEANRASSASDERLRFALDAARMGVWEWDIIRDDMRWTPGAPQFWSAGGDLRGTFADWLAVVFPDDREGVARAFAEAIKGRRPFYASEHRVIAGEQRVRWIDVRGRVFFDGGGRAARMAGTFMDTTQRRAFEEQRSHAEKMKTMGQLAGGVAHELNNLLTVILTHTQLLQATNAEDAPLMELTLPVREAAERATALTRQLLVLSRPELVVPQVLNLNEVTGTLASVLQRLVGAYVQLDIVPDEQVWPARMDRRQCEQILLNLAANAREAMPLGGTLRIATRNVPGATAGEPFPSSEDRVLLEVSDTGVGMTDEVQAKVCQPFFTTKAKGRGAGLGLTICQTVIANAGGSLHLESSPSCGTTVRVYLPRAHDEVDQPPSGGRGLPRGSVAERVLVVEDDALVRGTAERALRMAGYTVVVAADGEQALRMLQTRPVTFDLLFTKILMPRMGGIELANAVRVRAPTMKVLFTSGYPIDNTTEMGLPRDASLLAKPFTATELTQRVRELLDQARAERGEPVVPAESYAVRVSAVPGAADPQQHLRGGEPTKGS